MRLPSPTPRQLNRAIIGLNGIMFLACLIFSGRHTNFSLNPFTAFSPATNTLIFMGATGTIPINHYREWWSLITASWLHGSLLHIIFNMTALAQIGHLVMEAYGVHRTFIIYTLSGIAGFYLSYVAGVSVTIGASASICGLIGATLYFGKSRKDTFGQAVYKQTMGWVFSLLIFGFAIPNINNWGHGGGIVAGIGLGWLLGYHETREENIWHYLLSVILMAITLLILLWVITSAAYLNL